ncbi:MAG: hypothetical protein AAF730_18280, partial [Bacteroidota bacterium]
MSEDLTPSGPSKDGMPGQPAEPVNEPAAAEEQAAAEGQAAEAEAPPPAPTESVPEVAPTPEPEPEADPNAPMTLLEKYTAHYPGWAKEFARKYFTKTLSAFVFHGNVRDLVPTEDADGNTEYLGLRDFLVNDLFAMRDVVVFYDRSSGIHFLDNASQTDFNRALSGYDTIFGTEYAKKLPKDPVRVMSVLENYFR